jgi:predicted RNase H-like nuclease (RuvC/YqgF family)
MNQTEHLQMIGPWGYMGWLLAVCLGLLFYRQWTSDPQTALRKMQEELKAARETITQLRHLVKHLTTHNDELHVQVSSLQTDNRELHQQMALLKQANDLQAEVMARMERQQKELQDKYDNMVARVMNLEAKLGLL